MTGDAAYGRSEAGLHRITGEAARARAGLQPEVVEARDGKYDVGDGRGHGGIGEVGDVLLAVVRHVVDGGAEGLLHLSDGAAEGDEGGALCDAGDGEALTGEPGGDLREIAAAEAEARTELLRRKPLVIAGRAGIELRGEELVEVGLLGRSHAEAHGERFELAIGWREAEIGRVTGAATDAARQRNPAAAVDGAGDAVLHRCLVLHGCLGRWEERGNKESCGESKKTRGDGYAWIISTLLTGVRITELRVTADRHGSDSTHDEWLVQATQRDQGTQLDRRRGEMLRLHL